MGGNKIFSLKNKVAIITGGATGLGREISSRFAKEGAKVIINYNKSKDEAETLAKILREKYGTEVVSIKADVSKSQDVIRLLEKSLEIFSRIDILINNAGLMGSPFFNLVTDTEVDEILNVNLKGNYNTMKIIGNYMFERKYGRIVSVTSDAYFTGSVRAPHYAASKGGIVSLVKSFALLYAPYVLVNGVAPGFMKTEALLQRKDMTEERLKQIIESTPTRSLVDPAEVAALIAFLASDEIKNLTGEVIVINGGRHLRC